MSRIAHLVLAHRDPRQVAAYARQLAAEGDADVYVHYDAKRPESEARAIAESSAAIVLRERISVTWGDYDTVQAELLLLRAALASGKPYTHLCLSSGQDLLIRPGLGAWLAGQPGRTFMEAARFEANDPRNIFQELDWPREIRRKHDFPLHPVRIIRFALFCLFAARVNPFPNPRRLPEGWRLHRGVQWFCMSSEAARHVLAVLDQDPGLEDAFREAFIPDMLFFQTLLMNGPLAPTVTGQSLTYARHGTTYATRAHPVTLRRKDIPALEASGRFFARKFDATVDPEAVRHFLARLKVPQGLEII
jgi:hypothetical protein